MSTTHTPMQKFGTTVRLAGGGGFDVRGCPDPEALTETIVRACNAHDALVASLKDAIQAAAYWKHQYNGNALDDGFDQWSEKAFAALAAAGAA